MAMDEIVAEVLRLATPFGGGIPRNQDSCFAPENPVGRVCPSAPLWVHESDGALGQTRPTLRFMGSAHGARLPLVELTGGEPLLQKHSLGLMTLLGDEGFAVLLETSGAHDVSQVDPRVHRIVDLKCPSSGEVARNRWENLDHLRGKDEIKFVIGTAEDYAWAKQQITDRQLAAICPLLVSWASPLTPAQRDKSLKRVPEGQSPISRTELAERIIADALPVRFQVQMHKVVWSPDARGV